jgi:hypothetical protein
MLYPVSDELLESIRALRNQLERENKDKLGLCKRMVNRILTTKMATAKSIVILTEAIDKYLDRVDG